MQSTAKRSLPLKSTGAITAALAEGTLRAVACVTCRRDIAFRGEPCEQFDARKYKARPCRWCGVVVGGKA